ncbi:MAG: hypothetical protein LUE86_08020 [Clostridiales bacterium]|nr:hypothetical protein [Clostridiales bacterium]
MKFKKGIIQPGMIIHCKTEEQAKALLKYLDSLGYKWLSGEFLTRTTRYYPDDGRTYYRVETGHVITSVSDDVLPVFGKNITELSDLVESESRFKVGDKVAVRSDLSTGLYNGNYLFNEEMGKFKGKALTITEVITEISYRIKEDNGRWIWTDEMLVPVIMPLNNLPIDSPMSAVNVLGWLKAHLADGIMVALFGTEFIDHIFEDFTAEEIIDKITDYEIAHKPKREKIEYGFRIEVYDSNGNLWRGDYYYRNAKAKVESLARKAAMECAIQTGKPATWRVLDSCRVISEPIQGIVKKYNGGDVEGECPRCHSFLDGAPKFCTECGQALVWKKPGDDQMLD